MSAVDPKPTYTRTEECFLTSIAFQCRTPKTRDKILEFVGEDLLHSDVLDIRDLAQSGKLIDFVDNAHDMDDDVSYLREMAAYTQESKVTRSREDNIENLALAFLQFCSNQREIVMGSAAAFRAASDVVLKGVDSAHMIPNDIDRVLPSASELLVASTAALKTNPEFIAAIAKNFHAVAARQCANEWNHRKAAEDISYHTVSRRVRLHYNIIISPRHRKSHAKYFPDGYSVNAITERLSGMIRRGESHLPDIEYFYMGPIRAIRYNHIVYIMGTENIRRIYHIHHRRCMAIVNASLQAVVMPSGSFASSMVLRSLTRCLIEGAADNARNGKPISCAARSMHQLWCAHFARAYESLQGEGNVANWEERYDEICKSAYEMCGTAKSMNTIANTLPANVALDALRVHHIMAAPDTPPEMLADLTAGIPKAAKKPQAARHQSFLKFTKTYILCTYLLKHREWPSVDGNMNAVENAAYAKCLRGKFVIPSERDWGELWISGHFPYIRYSDQFTLRAKDATRVPDDAVSARSMYRAYGSWEHNELLHAIKRGSNLGAPHYKSIDEARDEFWSRKEVHHNLILTAAKAEVTKSDVKPRGTFSATGEFRHAQAEFDRNCQTINDLMGCGSIRADPVSHAKGMARVCKGTALNYTSTSHDIESWSPSQDRDAWVAYASIYINAFKGLDAKAYRNSWGCFDSVISKNAQVHTAHIPNGGFQGFPGTLDTSHHVMVLIYFLHRMREAGNIPRDVPTLAKATIDDCLAQMATWLGTLQDLETELADHYIKLGYVIDKVKSVISKCKAIYLNQAMIRGAFLCQGTKVMCKVDRPLEVVLKTPIDDMSACFAGCKAAIQAGNEPLSAYFLSSVIGMSYLYRVTPDVFGMTAQSVVLAHIAPRGDGGLGIPTLADIVCKEHPDPRAQANHAIHMYFKGMAMRNVEAHDHALKLYVRMKTRPMSVVSKMRIFFNPRSIHREGIPALESIKRSSVINAARSWAEADPYSGVLNMAHSDAARTVYSALLCSCDDGLDVSFLEAYSAHLPESMLDSIVGKVTSYKVASELLGPREIISIQGLINAKFTHLTKSWEVTSYPEGLNRIIVMDSICSVSGYSRTVQEREEFYALNQVKLVNHTIASPFEVVTVSGIEEGPMSTASVSSNCSSLRHWASDCPASSVSMVSSHGIGVPFKSAGWIVDHADVHKNLDQISHRFVEGCAVIEWAKSAGEDMRAWEYVYLHRWLGPNQVSTNTFIASSMQGSIKRSSAAAGDRSHPIFIGQNLQKSVMVNISPLNALITEGEYDIDPLSIISVCYAFGTFNFTLLINSLSKNKMKNVDFHWSIGLHTDCMTERFPFVCHSNANLNALASIFEIELDDMSFADVGGGCEKQLVKLCEPGALQALLRGQTLISDDIGLPPVEDDHRQLAPMYGVPHEAPMGAEFILGKKTGVAKGLIVQDSYEGASRVRLLEISATSARACATSALLQAAEKIGKTNIARYSVGDTDAISVNKLKDVCIVAASECINTVESNMASAVPILEAARGLRACGCTGFDWYDPDHFNATHMAEAFGRYATLNVDKVVRALRQTIPEHASMGISDYATSSRAVRIAKDPERANEAERKKQMRSKMRSRAAAYNSRLKLLKAGKPVKKSDIRASEDEKISRVAFLSGAAALMSSAEFEDGPVLDHYTTAVNLIKHISNKASEKNVINFATDALELMENGFIDQAQVCIAQGEKDVHWWRPSDYAKGVARAVEWAEEDCKVEESEVYFVPRTVQVKTRIRAHLVGSTSNRPADIDLTRRMVIPHIDRGEDPVIADDPEESEKDDSSIDESSSDDDALAMIAGARSKAPAPKPRDDRAFVESLHLWQVAVLILDLGAGVPEDLSAETRIRVTMTPRKVLSLDADEEKILREHLISDISKRGGKLEPPEYIAEEAGLSYVE